MEGTEAAQNARSYVFLFNAVYDNKRVTGPENTAIVSFLEPVLTATTDQSGTKFDHATAEAASTASALFAMTWLQNLLERYRNSGMNADPDRVQIEARHRGMDAGKEMNKRAHTFFIPEERIAGYSTWR